MISTLQKILIVVALFSGTLITLSFKMQNKQQVNEAGHIKNFYHPYMQVGLRTISLILCFVVVFLKGFKYQPEGAPKMNPFIIIIPQIFDIGNAFCYYVALNFIPASIYQMLRGGTVLTTYLFTVLILKKQPKKQKVLGCGIVLLGLITVGLVNIFLGQTKQTSEGGLVVVGYGLIILGIILSGLHFIMQEWLIRKYSVHPLWLVSIEGSFGFIIAALIIPFLALASCPFSQNACVYNDDGEAVVQNMIVYFRQVFSHTLIWVGFIIVLISLTIYDSVGVLITKRIGSLARAVVDVSRTVIIWVAAVVITATLGSQNKSFKWQSLEFWELVGQSVGFLLLIVGNVIYYEFIRIGFLQQKEEVDEVTQNSLIQVQ